MQLSSKIRVYSVLSLPNDGDTSALLDSLSRLCRSYLYGPYSTRYDPTHHLSPFAVKSASICDHATLICNRDVVKALNSSSFGRTNSSGELASTTALTRLMQAEARAKSSLLLLPPPPLLCVFLL